jgi:hypothetical protein
MTMHNLYLNDINYLISDKYKVEQTRFMYDHIVDDKFKKYYILSEKLLRKEKLNKIDENNFEYRKNNKPSA